MRYLQLIYFQNYQDIQGEKKIINVDYFVGIKKVIPKGGKSHRRMSVNQERKSQGVPEDGNEAIINK